MNLLISFCNHFCIIEHMINRTITSRLVRLFEQYPFVTVTGPRHSGKTTLCRNAFPHLKYVNLEAPDVQELARDDPRRFLSHINQGAIIDEIQRVPGLLSYLQVFADEKRQNSQFVLTGSENFKLSDAIGQSLAGRTGLIYLLPLSIAERRSTGAGESIEDILYSGFYPRVFDQQVEANQAYSDYFETYVERDIRRIGEIRNLQGFQRFVRLCAGRIGQLANLNQIGADAGISHTTAKNWLNLLETSFIAFRLSPYHANIRKRLVKTPKIYFYDVGLASYLIGIKQPEQISTHPMRGPLFENMVVAEILKYCFNTGRREVLSFFRDSQGLEYDLLFEANNNFFAIEIKSGATVTGDYFKSLNKIENLIPNISRKIVVYGGSARQTRSSIEVVPFGELSEVIERFEVEEETASFSQSNLPVSPEKSDLSIIDLVFYLHIRPTLDNLEPVLMRHIKPLFQRFHAGSKLHVNHQTVSSGSILHSTHWKRTKEEYIVLPGFNIHESGSLKIVHKFQFMNLVRNPDFNLNVSLEWSIESDTLVQNIYVGESPCPELLDLRWPFTLLGTRSAKIDFICSTILKTIMSAIRNFRNKRPN